MGSYRGGSPPPSCREALKAPLKQYLIRADGSIEEYKGEAIAGARFHVPFVEENGDHWERVYEINWAVTDKGVHGPITIVGVEVECSLTRTAEQVRKDDERLRLKVLNECLRGIRGEA